MGLGGVLHLSIPAASIDRVAAQFPGEEHVFRRCMRAMDRVYLEISNRDPDAPKVNMSRNFGPGDLMSIGKG